MIQKLIFTVVAFIISVICYGQHNIAQVSDYKAVFTAPPQNVPSNKVPDGPVAGIGDVGFVIGGTASEFDLYFSKNDFWKSKPGYPDGGVFLVGGLKVKIPVMKNTGYYAEQRLDDATIKLNLKNKLSSISINSWVAASQNTVIIQLENEGESVDISLDLWGQEGNGSINKSGSQDKVSWITRSFEATDLEWPTHIAVAMNTLGTQSKTFTLSDEPVTLIIGFCTNHDSSEYFEKTIEIVSTTNLEIVKGLRDDHEKWWSDFWSKSAVKIGDVFLEKCYYGSQYLLASCSRNVNFPPGLWGNTLTEDASFYNWAGDYHLNYNYQAPWWGAYSSNHIELTEPYDTPILEYMDNAKKHAKEILNCDGVYYPVGIGPKGFCSSLFPIEPDAMKKYYGTTENDIEGGIMFLGQKSNNLFCASNMFMRFYSTYDKKYAEKVYPFLSEVAKFWESYLVYENGRYVSKNDNFWEVGPWEGKDWKENYGDINPTVTLGMLRMFFRGIINVSTFLDVDNDKHEEWKHILSNLSEIPTVKAGDNIRIKACEGGNGSGSRTLPGLGRVMLHGLIFPSDAYGEIRDTAFLSILKNEISLWGTEPIGDADWSNMGNGFETFFTAAARIGIDPEIILSTLKDRIRKTLQPNLWISQAGGGIETFSAVPSCINEMLMQSYEGTIRLFPTWPLKQDAKFYQLRAYGAFLISSELANEEVKYIKVVSEKGRDLNIVNPWKNSSVQLTRGNSTKTLAGKTLNIKTSVGEIIELKNLD
jgi:alpha-L-fucosidase 2